MAAWETHGLAQAIDSLRQQNTPFASLCVLDSASHDIDSAILKQIERMPPSGVHLSESSQPPPHTFDENCPEEHDQGVNHREIGLQQKADGNHACAFQHFAAHRKLMKIEVDEYDDADAHYNYAEALMEVNSVELAVSSYKQAVALAPDDQGSYDALIRAQFLLIATEEPYEPLGPTLPAMSKALEDVVHGAHCKVLRGLLPGVHFGAFFTEHYYEKGVFHFRGHWRGRWLPVDAVKSKQLVESLHRNQNRREVHVAVHARRVCARCGCGCGCQC
jgi:tetratricopeptide (TPR) repeat protein